MDALHDGEFEDDARHLIRRKADQAAMGSLSSLAESVTSMQKALTSAAVVAGGIVMLLFWLGWKQVSPAESMLLLQGQILSIRTEGIQRDSLIHQISKNVALLTYYRCEEENKKSVKEKDARPLTDCIRVYQDGDK